MGSESGDGAGGTRDDHGVVVTARVTDFTTDAPFLGAAIDEMV